MILFLSFVFFFLFSDGCAGSAGWATVRTPQQPPREQRYPRRSDFSSGGPLDGRGDSRRREIQGWAIPGRPAGTSRSARVKLAEPSLQAVGVRTVGTAKSPVAVLTREF